MKNEELPNGIFTLEKSQSASADSKSSYTPSDNSSFFILHSSFPLLSSTYFGPIQWYQKLNRSEICLIERYDSFIKQTYRNRCVIATTNGLQALTVPVERALGNGKMLMKDVRVSEHGNWRHVHWNALLSAYGESPFFEYYADDIRPFFEKHWEYLYDLNMEITHTMCDLLDIHPRICHTNEFVKGDENKTPLDIKNIADDCSAPPISDDLNYTDYREVIRPKHPLPDPCFKPRRYYQVYERKHGFQPNLSILDLLFNMGNESIFYL